MRCVLRRRSNEGEDHRLQCRVPQSLEKSLWEGRRDRHAEPHRRAVALGDPEPRRRLEGFRSVRRSFRRHARLVRRRRSALPDIDDALAGRRTGRQQHGREPRGQPARRLFRRQRLDVHPLRHPHRYAQSLRLRRSDIQRLQHRQKSGQPGVGYMRGGKAPADLRARRPAGCRGAARRPHAAAEPRHRRGRPEGLRSGRATWC